MIMSRRLFRATIIAMVLLLGIGACILHLCTSGFKPGITPENASRIRNGMTLAEVDAVLGGPSLLPGEWPRDYDLEPHEMTFTKYPIRQWDSRMPSNLSGVRPHEVDPEGHISDRVQVYVWFMPNGRVGNPSGRRAVLVGPNRAVPASPWQYLLDWLDY
jgi:hypothetical protein